jgi:hypothetical protein
VAKLGLGLEDDHGCRLVDCRDVFELR